MKWLSFRQWNAELGIPGRAIDRHARVVWGLLATWPLRDGFARALAAMPHWDAMYDRRPALAEPFILHFIDRRLSARQRLAHLAHDLATATRLFGVADCERLARGEALPLWRRTGEFEVKLIRNDGSQCEGMWALCLDTADGVRCYRLSFSFLACGRLVIGSVQGAKAEDDAAMRAIRDITRAAHGLRPPRLLAEVLRALAGRWRLPIAGIDLRHHAKKRCFHRELKVKFDYADFYRQLGATPGADGYWAVPAGPSCRNLAEVSPKHRARYRRRQQLIDELNARLGGEEGAPACENPPRPPRAARPASQGQHACANGTPPSTSARAAGA